MFEDVLAEVRRIPLVLFLALVGEAAEEFEVFRGCRNLCEFVGCERLIDVVKSRSP